MLTPHNTPRKPSTQWTFAPLLLLGLSFLAIFFFPHPAKAQKVYGNWCGPNHGFKGAPIDAVDRVCMLHDNCCRAKGHGPITEKIQHCDCDRIIVQNMPRAIRQTPKAKGKAAGATIFSYFRVAPCFCWKNLCVTVPVCTKVKKCKKVLKKRICTFVPKCSKQKKCKRTKVMGAGGRCL